MDSDKQNDSEKQYRVVDRRGKYADDQTQDKEPSEASADPDDSEPADAGGQSSQGEADGTAAGGSPEPRIEDAIRYSLNVIREQVFYALGLIISKERAVEPDMDRVGEITRIFLSLADRFAGLLSSGETSEANRPAPSLEDTLNFCFNLIQGQVLMYLGLIPNPVTGQAGKDRVQAKMGVDFCAALLEAARPLIEPEKVRRFEGYVAELKMAYVQYQ